MHITDIALRDFRNYESLRLTLSDGLTVFCGDNAQGKTNLIEAIYLCCLGKSPRTNHDTELIRHGKGTAYVGVNVQRNDGPRHVEVLLSHNEKKRILVSGVALKRMSELMGHVKCLLFSPEDLLLIKSGPAARRRFMDSSLCQLRPAYFLLLARYNAIVLQRNSLLKQQAADVTLLDAYDQMLSEYGADIIENRRSFLHSLLPYAQSIHGNIANAEQLLLSYKTQADSADTSVAAQLAALYKKTRHDDIRRMRTLIGPHRDDIVLSINGNDARAYASQGQQRTVSLSLKLAGVEQMAAETGQAPLLMLDDVFSELDEKRQKALINHMRGQVLLTTATTALPELLEQGQRFIVRNGRIQTPK